MKTWLLLLLLTIPLLLSAQEQEPPTLWIHGTIRDSLTAESCPYVKVYNSTRKELVLSNDAGQFRLAVSSPEDVLVFSYTGYRTLQLQAGVLLRDSLVRFSQSVNVLDELIVLADDHFLYELFAAAYDRKSPQSLTAKTYLQVASEIDGQQVELAEAYFNGTYRDQVVNKLAYKEGRLALTSEVVDSTAFLSRETYQAVLLLQPGKRNDYLPLAPFALGTRAMRKQFRLELNKAFRNEQEQTVYIISFAPRTDDGSCFSGTAWIDSSSRNLLQLQLHTRDARVHPFATLNEAEDTIRQVAFDITYVFTQRQGQPTIDYVYFNYAFDFVSHRWQQRRAYTVASSVVLHAYDYTSAFVPLFFESSGAWSDFRKINSYPYNEAFWKEIICPVSPEKARENAAFFRETSTFNTNDRNLLPGDRYGRGMLEAPYVPWSERRIAIRYTLRQNYANTQNVSQPPASRYQLSAHLYGDVNVFDGTLHVLTAAIIDPYETFYHLEPDSTTDCFLNLYFDLAEIERRAFEQAIAGKSRSVAEIHALLVQADATFQSTAARYLKEVDRGTNYKALQRWNALVREELGIDNFRYFGLVEE